MQDGLGGLSLNLLIKKDSAMLTDWLLTTA